MATESGKPCWIPANWEAPAMVKAGTSTRHGGNSLPPYASMNLALHVGDTAETVLNNRVALSNYLKLPTEPVWLEQVHGNRIINDDSRNTNIADGMYTEEAGVVCTVMTADCVPVLLCNSNGTEIAAVHAGWRGLCAGVLDNAVSCFRTVPDELLVWIGPHIRQDNYEVRDDVRDACINQDTQLRQAFVRNNYGHWQADLELLVRLILLKYGISKIYSIGQCTYAQADNFYSYRRNPLTGRTASMIWIDK